MFTPLTFAAVVVVSSIATALAALIIVAHLPIRRRRKPALAHFDTGIEPTIFLFEGRELIDATRPARHLLESIDLQGEDWDRLTFFLGPRIPHFSDRIKDIATTGVLELSSGGDGELKVVAENLGAHLRLTVEDKGREGQGILVDGLSLRAQEEELRSLRDTVMHAPVLVWRTTSDGAVSWANTAYLEIAASTSGINPDELTWPIPAVFQTIDGQPSGEGRRQKITLPGRQEEHWFDRQSFVTQNGTLHFAVPADATVKAEQSLSGFVQTLTKTFAHLPIALAVFDRKRQLALFNPALIDLTTLDAAFLSARPTLTVFLDRLREVRIIPEPKDYRVWRQQMTELEKAAASGLYEDNWTLPTGQTYKVTGRPHPDGAIAFLIEDITGEITLTRHFRSEIELGQAVVDKLDEAIAVFSPGGDLILSNSAYAKLWETDPGAAFGTVTIRDSARLWQSMTASSDLWDDACDFVDGTSERVEWAAEISHKDGRLIYCRVTPIPGGRTLIGFDTPQPDRSPSRRIRHSRREGQNIVA
ncbi:MAG: PAS-domain containing protein [Rhodobacteraceae bacterium]|nr:PAS-domain containing protein [Paracoccaceae bacterium]